MSNNNCGCNNTTTTHACNSCQSTPCTPQPICDCPGGYMSSDCVNNVKAQFECLNIESNQTLTETFEQMDSAICDKFAEVDSHFDLVNVGTGEDVYKGINLLGQKEIKTIKSAGGTVTITTSVDGNEINLEAGDPTAISITSDDDSVTITEGDGVIDLSVDTSKSFLELTDTPNDYNSDTLKLVRVNSAETGLEFVVDNSVKQLTTTNPGGTPTTYSPTAGVINLPNASLTEAGIITNTTTADIQKFKGRKRFVGANQGVDQNSVSIFDVRSADETESFLAVRESGWIYITGNMFTNKILDFKVDEPIPGNPPNGSSYTGRIRRSGDRLVIGEQTNGSKSITLDLNTGNTTIGGSGTGTSTTTEIFEVFATDKGSIPFPRMTYIERTGFTPSKTGTHVYQTNTASGFAEGVYVWKTSGWVFAY
jgi:hypothetical protein